MLIDSGATGNYVSAQECAVRGIKIEKEKDGKELTIADGLKVKTIGRVRLNVKCGGYHGIVEARVFPEMSKPIILRMPWLVKESPHINWTRSTVVVQHGQEWFSPPLASLDEDQSVHHINQKSAKQMSRLLKRKQVDNAFMGFVRMVKEENVAEKYKRKSVLGAVHMWREDLPPKIKAVLDDYEDVFPKDLPPGLPPICKGHECKIELEDNMPIVHWLLYKLRPLELAKAKK